MSENENVEVESVDGGELVYRAADPGEMSFSEETDGRTLEGRMVPYGEWTEVNSSMEGHFLERFAPGSLAKPFRLRPTTSGVAAPRPLPGRSSSC